MQRILITSLLAQLLYFETLKYMKFKNAYTTSAIVHDKCYGSKSSVYGTRNKVRHKWVMNKVHSFHKESTISFHCSAAKATGKLISPEMKIWALHSE